MAVKPRLTGIEAGRGVAATAVVLYHAARHLNKVTSAPALMRIFQFGHAGVDFFFVISGFIILYVHERDIGLPTRIGHYTERRFSRVMPTYWVALALTILLASAGGRHGLPSATDALWSILLLPSHAEPLLGVAWTLQYEIVFYAMFAVLIVKRRAGFLAFGLWAAWIVSALNAGATGWLPGSLNGVLNLEFFAGMGVAIWLKRYKVPAPLLLLVVGIALFAVAGAAEDTGYLDGYGNLARIAYGAASMLTVLALAAADLRQLLRVPALLRVLGAASYSIYLFQFIFIGTIWKILGATGLAHFLPNGVAFIVLASGAVFGGVAASRLVEYPLMRLLRAR
jgi:peptidoglycan/LPS O-acetylase OafA/YrhL